VGTGDADTASGNCSINLALDAFNVVLWTWFSKAHPDLTATGGESRLSPYEGSIKLPEGPQLFDVLPLPSVAAYEHQYSFMCLGDDRHALGKASFISTFPSGKLMARLAMKLTEKVFVGPDAIYHSTYLSSRFYPTGNRLILGPCIGRQLGKAGWAVRQPLSKPYTDSLLRGDTISALKDCGHVPWLREYFQRLHALLGPGAVRVDPRSRHKFKHHTEKQWEYDDTTLAAVEVMYGVTPDDLLAFKKQLATIYSLPAVLDNPCLSSMCVTDGTTEDAVATHVTPFSSGLPDGGDHLSALLAPFDPRCATCHAVLCQCGLVRLQPIPVQAVLTASPHSLPAVDAGLVPEAPQDDSLDIRGPPGSLGPGPSLAGWQVQADNILLAYASNSEPGEFGVYRLLANLRDWRLGPQ
jgi:hypothetical protein